MTPRITAGMISLGRLVIWTSPAQCEGNRENGADDAAIDGEWRQAVGLEEPQQELHREVRRDPGGDRAHQGLAADVVTLVAEQLRKLEQTGGADDRGREEEGEAGRLFVGEPREQAPAHAGAGAREPRDQGKRLGGADPDR